MDVACSKSTNLSSSVSVTNLSLHAVSFSHPSASYVPAEPHHNNGEISTVQTRDTCMYPGKRARIQGWVAFDQVDLVQFWRRLH